MSKAMEKNVFFIIGIILIPLLLYLFVALTNIVPLICRSVNKLGSLLNMDLSDSNISYIDSDIDWLAGDTTIIIFVNQKEFELSVNEYTRARWLDIDGREAPISPGELHILEKYKITQDNIKSYGYTFSSIKRVMSTTEYQISCYKVLSDSNKLEEETYIIVTIVPRIILVDKNAILIS